jgi:hypothetical protein
MLTLVEAHIRTVLGCSEGRGLLTDASIVAPLVFAYILGW